MGRICIPITVCGLVLCALVHQPAAGAEILSDDEMKKDAHWEGRERSAHPHIHVYPADPATVTRELKLSTHFVMFYMPWSGHCRKMLENFDELALKYNVREGRQRVTILRVNCYTETAEVCEQNGVTGHPTLMFFKSGTGERYDTSDDRWTAERIDRFLEDNLPPLKSDILMAPDASAVSAEISGRVLDLTDATFASHIIRGRHFVEFYSPDCGHCRALEPQWEQLAAHFQHYPTLRIGRVDCMSAWPTCSHYEVHGYPTLIFFSEGRFIQQYKGVRSLHFLKMFTINMLDFLDGVENQAEAMKQLDTQDVSVDIVEVLTTETFTKRLSVGTRFVLFYEPKCEFCKELYPVWTQLSEQCGLSNNQVMISKLDCVRNFDTCASEFVFSYPTLILYKDGHRLDSYEGARDLQSLIAFVDDMKDKSAEQTETDEISHVASLIPATFNEHIEAVEFVFVNFFKAWCEHCQRLAPVWEQLAAAHTTTDETKNEARVSVAKVDCVLYDDLCQRYEIAGYPSMHLFVKGKRLDLYTGPHELESLSTYLLSYTKQSQTSTASQRMLHAEL